MYTDYYKLFIELLIELIVWPFMIYNEIKTLDHEMSTNSDGRYEIFSVQVVTCFYVHSLMTVGFLTKIKVA